MLTVGAGALLVGRQPGTQQHRQQRAAEPRQRVGGAALPGSRMLGLQRAEYSRRCLQRGRAARTGVEVLLDLDAGRVIEGAIEQRVGVRAGVSTRAGRRIERGRLGAGERADQSRPSALHALVGCVGANAEQLSDLRRPPSLGIVEHDGDPVCGREAAQRRPECHLLLGCGKQRRLDPGRGVTVRRLVRPGRRAGWSSDDARRRRFARRCCASIRLLRPGS